MNQHDNDLLEGFQMTALGPLPAEWQVVALDTVLTEVDVRVRDFKASDASKFPILSLTKNFGLMLQSERFGKRIAIDDVSDYKVVQRGQIVYNPYVIWEGAVHILRTYDYGLVSPVYPVWRGKVNKAESYFVDRLLRMPLAIAAYNRFAAGAVNRRRAIRKKDFLAIQIPLPPLPEQRAIVHVLSTIQGAVEAQGKVIAAARELKKSLLRHLFTYGPVPPAQADQVPLQESEIGPVPGHWEVVTVGDVVEATQYGISLRGNQKGKYPILRMNNLTNGRVDTSDLQYVDLERRDFQKFRVNKGDILFNRTNSYELVGKTALFNMDGDYVFASYLVKVVTDNGKLFPNYLNYYLNWEIAQNRLRSLATRGVSQSNINATKLRGFQVSLPPLPEQRDIARILSAVDRKIEAEDKRKAALQTLLKTTLQHLMTGQVRVGAGPVPAP
jgi:type I restriction enzyme S subunit